ncbi:hypothetical protein AVANI_46 [Mycobacterium phage Avani]|nr:hypothetical protein CL78_gp046 [Mycobacterium phage Avani]YP_009591348.1 hypothetical protein FDG57_gp041 [Mycobacterium phage Mutaforma13]AEJ93185.1 hypothetical protein MUTAFORMA13_41 [Mycobacterium phage Mutaforma13]AFL47957.1 hypothetical protein AVANI_46 [Mycobacterium phage Avani]
MNMAAELSKMLEDADLKMVYRRPLRCEACGKFCTHLNEVWRNPYQNGIDHSECDTCYSRRMGA